MSVPAIVCVGLATQDTVFHVPHPPGSGGRVVATDLVTAGGGPAATAAVTVARLGVEAAFVGAVGDDDVGHAIRDGLAAEGVDVSELRVVPGARSPRSALLVEGRTAERSIVHYPGTLAPLDLSERAVALCRGAEWVHVDQLGYAAAPKGVRLSIDGGNPIPGLDLDGVALYAPTEAALLAAYGGPDNALAAGAQLVVATRGAGGCVAYGRDGMTLEVDGFEVEAVSALGAGDVFHGALLAQLVLGDELPLALRRANLAAALSCRALDARSAIPWRQELDERSSTWQDA
ncbi:MAG TPA: PfkB family carbohydrate kinase [Gaiellaceae bacterium]|nr:PfkB family carbohydrate kinase [Gaiellaceae bacterium]